jgi:hypothetical protein
VFQIDLASGLAGLVVAVKIQDQKDDGNSSKNAAQQFLLHQEKNSDRAEAEQASGN